MSLTEKTLPRKRLRPLKPRPFKPYPSRENTFPDPTTFHESRRKAREIGARGKVVVITGAGAGIGRATACALRKTAPALQPGMSLSRRPPIGDGDQVGRR